MLLFGHCYRFWKWNHKDLLCFSDLWNNFHKVSLGTKCFYSIFTYNTCICVCAKFYIFFGNPYPTTTSKKYWERERKEKFITLSLLVWKSYWYIFTQNLKLDSVKMHHWIANLHVNLILDFLKLLKTCLIHIQTAQC